MSTKNNPGEFDCYAKARPDEPMFVLLARDPHAPSVVRSWAALRATRVGTLDGKCEEAFAVADEMEAWARSPKTPATGFGGGVRTIIEREAQPGAYAATSSHPEGESRAWRDLHDRFMLAAVTGMCCKPTADINYGTGVARIVETAVKVADECMKARAKVTK